MKTVRFFEFWNALKPTVLWFLKISKKLEGGLLPMRSFLIHFGWMVTAWTNIEPVSFISLNSSLVDECHVSSLGMKKKSNVSFLRDEKDLMSLSLVMNFGFMYYKKLSRHFAFLILHFIMLYPSDTHQTSQEKGKFCKNFYAGYVWWMGHSGGKHHLTLPQAGA